MHRSECASEIVDAWFRLIVGTCTWIATAALCKLQPGRRSLCFKYHERSCAVKFVEWRPLSFFAQRPKLTASGLARLIWGVKVGGLGPHFQTTRHSKMNDIRCQENKGPPKN